MFELEDRHWWFQSRLLMIERLLRDAVEPACPSPPRLLDLGCGTGMFLDRRRKAGAQVFGTDISGEALRFSRRRGLDRLARSDATRIPYADTSFDIVTAFDLIEHVKDDRALVAEARRVLRPGGFLVATVPAHPFLWSSHDVSLHHHRRYRRAQFEGLFAGGGWQTVRMTASFAMILPPAALIRLSRRLRRTRRPPHSDAYAVPDWLNRMLIGLHRAEAAWLARWDLPAGVSLLTIRRRVG